jgi:2-phospho-L-lactate guanylyltransferase
MGTAPPRPFGVVVPIRAFRLGNTRLAAGLDDRTRHELSRRLAERVVAAAGPAPVLVVTSAPEVVGWAADLGLDVADDPGTLDGAARIGVAGLGTRGCERAVVAHADLPFVRDYSLVTRDLDDRTVALVPCHRGDGTPVLSIPVGVHFTFAYGPGSFRRHTLAAQAAGLAVRVVHDRALAFDVDTLDDVSALAQLDPTLLGSTTPDRRRSR